MLEKLGIKITLIATLIVTIYAYFNNDNFLKTCYAIITTIVVFYFLGGFIELFLKKQLEKIEEQKNKEQKQDDDIDFQDDMEFIEELEEKQDMNVQ